MKVTAVVLIVLAVGIAVVPMFTDCLSQGKSLKTTTGMSVPMKCHWSGVAELALAVPLAVVGGLLAFSRRKESRRNLSIVGAALGAVAILVPTALIGVCASSDMLCNSVMRPALILMGTLTIAMSLVGLVIGGRSPELAA
jgi:hypothetical protein